MSVLVQIVIKPHQQEDKDFILNLGLKKARLNPGDISDWRIRKKSLDARNTSIKINLQLEFWNAGEVRVQVPAWAPF